MSSTFWFRRFMFVVVILSLLITPFFWIKYFPGLNTSDLISRADENAYEQTNHAVHFFENENAFEMNPFEMSDGLFSFQYSNHLTIKQYEGVYYLQDLRNKRVVFQIFESHPSFTFDQEDFTCYQYNGEQSTFFGKEICFSKNPPEGFLINLELFGKPYRFFDQQVQFFANKHLLDKQSFGYFDFLSRSEAIRLVLSLRYPKKDFSQYADDCFLDIKKADPLSGYLCFAKERGILAGIQGSLHPEQSINLHGLLKILFLSYEIEDYDFDERYLDESLFEQMQKIHIAYPLIAKAYYEGIFLNTDDQIFWANRNIYMGEAIGIIYRFLQWKEGFQLKKYESKPAFTVDTVIYSKKQDFSAQFERDEKISFDSDDLMVSTKLVRRGLDAEVYFLDRGGVYRYLYTLPNTPLKSLKSLFVSFDTQRLKGKMVIAYEDGSQASFKLKRKKIDFSSLKDDFLDKGYTDSINKLEAAHLLPNLSQFPTKNTQPILRFYMGQVDFENIFLHRTGNNRYPTYLEMEYPDGKIYRYSALIKTRGNANRGYIKSGFTVESFVDFESDDKFEGDEFLNDADEFKLRGFINEETMIHEKLFYQAFRDLGYFSPQFFDGTLFINDIPLGYYQITEAVKKDFFKHRNIDVDNYYYARNSGASYNTNLDYYENDEITLSQYKFKGDPEPLLSLIKRLQENDETLMKDLNIKNIFDYAMSVYMMAASDSLTHNYYLYFDETSKKWNIFPWDADDSLYEVKPFNIWKFLSFVKKDSGSYNRLIYYLFDHLSFEEVQEYMEDYRLRWNQKMKLSDFAQSLLDHNHDYYHYDNQLWNHLFLERKDYEFNTIQAIKKLKQMLVELDELDREGINFKN